MHRIRSRLLDDRRGPLVHGHLPSRPIARLVNWKKTLCYIQVVAHAASLAGGQSPEPNAPSSLSSLIEEGKKLRPLLSRFLPMVCLFFVMAFANTLLDSLKDALIITAHGGGAQIIPWLTSYAVFPSSILFFFLYSYATQHFSRAQLFNSIVVLFMAFFVLFAYVLYPNHETLHPHQWADEMTLILPSGLDGMIGMIRNWTLTLFFVISELWGDVCLGLLFWGLANDTTSLSDAHLLYPLFGLGANLAQACAGVCLKMVRGQAAFSTSMQYLMLLVLALASLSLILHYGINERAERSVRLRAEVARKQALEEEQRLKEMDAKVLENRNKIKEMLGEEEQRKIAAKILLGPSATSSNNDQTEPALAAEDSTAESQSPKEKQKPSMREALSILAASVPIRCLAVMSLAQGLCSSLMEFAWKIHILISFPKPEDMTAFLGDVSTTQGLCTMLFMLASPALFKSIGWRGVAAATPQILLITGIGFFAACFMYQYVSSSSLLLAMVVYGGAMVYVFSRSAKFSLFKPAEEMVYISLDSEGRTKGKAAIDVVGSQLGKASGSFMQQALLLISGGAIAGSIVPMSVVFIFFANGWLESVNRLAAHNPHYGAMESVHEDLISLKSLDSDDESM